MKLRHFHPFHLLRTTLLAGLLLPALGSPAFAQYDPVATTTADDFALLGEEDLDQLLGPIALYPDALVAIILPASTVPTDVTLASRYLVDGDLDLVDEQPWEPSVVSLTRYPDVLAWMDENLEWTSALGEAFYAQPNDVMTSIQRLRQEAQTAGNLVNTPQQTVLIQEVSDDRTTYESDNYTSESYASDYYESSIRIVPTNPEIIYVPVYDPVVVYEPSVIYVDRQPDYVSNIISFGAGFAVGSWLDYAFDWNRNALYYGDNCGYNDRDYWYDRGSYDQGRNVNIVETNTNISNVNTITNVDNRNFNTWQPSTSSQRQISQRQRNNGGNARYASARQKDNRKPNKTATAPGKRKQSAVPQPNRIKADGKRRAAGPKKDQGKNKSQANKNGSKNNTANRPGSKNKQNKSNQPNQPKKPSKAPQVSGGKNESKNDKKQTAAQKQKEQQRKNNTPSGKANGQKNNSKQANKPPKSNPKPQASKNDKPKSANKNNAGQKNQNPKASKNQNAGQNSKKSDGKKKQPAASRPQPKKPSQSNQAKQRQQQPKKQQPKPQTKRQTQPQAQKRQPQQRPKQQKAQPRPKKQQPQQARPQQSRPKKQEQKQAKSQPKSNQQRAKQNNQRSNSSASKDERKKNNNKKNRD